ncbi:hypothetical protein [Halopseudomonas pelagia]|uniref:Uncharacterized protein n=1 Tax=Halopseudomonas pelagia TaxID=553151 RepID=A0AA91U5Z7_9GAMM|nr:hypothetical protein [Halopseudomonas pelagia]PCD01273.1 hypothetical protein CO192_01215 [Halopseudomonas pelagia]QFY57563.1 hypothetical protein EAO82_15015 [Halopseudomonas pelagia]
MQSLYILQLTAAFFLFGWRHLPEPYLGWLLLPVWAVAGYLIFASSIEAARLRRSAWLNQYLLADSLWHVRLRGGWLLNSWHLLLSAVLALFMLVKLLWLSPWLWLMLLVGLPLLWWLDSKLRSRLQSHVKPPLLNAVSRRLLVPLGAALFLCGYLLMSLSLSQPNMQGMDWIDALGRHMQDSQSSLPLLALSERAHQILELSVQWALQNTLGDADNSGILGVLAWSLLLISGSAFIWAWMRMLTGIAALRSKPAGVKNAETQAGHRQAAAAQEHR